MHITREILRAVARGDLPARFLVQAGLEHLTSLCSCCAREVEAWRADPTGAGDSLRPELVVRLLAAATPELVRAEERAERDLVELLGLPAEERLARVSRAHSRFRGRELVLRLLAVGRSRIHSDPESSHQLAVLALAIADRSNGVADLQALAAAAMGNACRARGQLRAADRHFEYVRFLVHTQDVTDLAALAEICDLEGSLRKDQGQFERAEELLHRAFALYRVARREARCPKVLVILADVHFHRGDVVRAIATVKAAIREISPVEEAFLYLS